MEVKILTHSHKQTQLLPLTSWEMLHAGNPKKKCWECNTVRVYRGLIQASVLMRGDWEDTRVYGKSGTLQYAYKVWSKGKRLPVNVSNLPLLLLKPLWTSTQGLRHTPLYIGQRSRVKHIVPKEGEGGESKYGIRQAI